MAAEVVSLRDGRLQLIKVGPLGYASNNGYVIADTQTNDAMIIDAPEESAQLAEAAQPFNVGRIVVTHRHPDHWKGIDDLKARIDAPVFTHEADQEPYAAYVSGFIGDGEELSFGGLSLEVIHTPGHTPGCVCLKLGEHLLSGDTLFPGGPGRTRTPEDLHQEIASIKTRLYVLPESTSVYPGHGDNTTVGESRAEFAIFEAKPHREDLSGDVLWLSS